MHLHPKLFLSEGWWIQLRNHTNVRDTLGKNYCVSWAKDLLKKLEGTSYQGLFEAYEDRNSPSLSKVELTMHTWLENRERGLRFIADGTAGQINMEYPYGFYGFLEQAPRELFSIYKNATKVPLIKNDKSSSLSLQEDRHVQNLVNLYQILQKQPLLFS